MITVVSSVLSSAQAVTAPGPAPITLSGRGGNLVIFDSSNLGEMIVLDGYTAPSGGFAGGGLYTSPTSLITFSGYDRLTVDGHGGDDTLDVTDVRIIGGGLTFNGGAGDFDTLIISDTAGVTSVEHTFVNANDGSVNVDGAVITYTGLEPVIDNLSAANRVFTFTGGAETITLNDDVTAGMMQVDSTLGEIVTFTNPTTSLLINAGTGNDVLDILSLDGAYAGSVTVDGGDGTDLVNLTAAADTFTVTGVKAGSSALADFTNIEQVDAGADNDTVNLTAGNDTFTLTGANAGGVAGIAFTNIEIVDAMAGSNTVDLTASNDTFTVTGANAGSVAGIAFSNIANVNALGGTDILDNNTGSAMTVGSQSVGGITGTGFETVDTPSLNLTAGADSFSLTGTNAGTGGGLNYIGLSSIDALGGSDTLNTNSGAALTGVAGQVFTHGVTVSNLENLASTNGLLNGTAGDDTLNLTGTNAGNGYGVNFTGISTLSAGVGNDTLHTNAPTIITSTPGLVTTNGVNVSALENLVSTDGNLQTTGLVDDITLTGNEAGNVRGINFTGITDLDAFSGTDTLNTNADSALTGTAGQVTSNGVTVSNLEVLGTSNGTLNGSAGADAITLTGNKTGSAGGISFSDVDTMDAAGGSDTVNTNASTTLTGSSSQVTTNGVTVSNVENLASTDGNLVGTGGGDTITLSGANSGSAYFVQFTGISAVDAAGGTDVLNTNAAVSLTGVANQVASNGVTVSNIETVFATNTLLNGSSGDDVIQLGATGVVANGVTIAGISTISSGDGSDQLDVTNVASMNGVTFNGGGPTGSDSILISDTSAVTTVTHTFVNANDGSINADGSILNYTGLEPVVDNLNATNRNFIFTGGAETITLQNAVGAGMMNIDSTLGENVTFTNPTTSLLIEAGSGDDVLNIQGLDVAYTGALNVTDSAGNLDLAGVNVANSAVVTSITTTGNLTDSGNVVIAGATTLSGVDITLGGAGEITNFGDLTITSTGNVTIQEDSVTNLVGANTAGSLNLTSTLGTLINGSVTTPGEQVYNSAVTLSGNTTLSAADTDADSEGIDFGSTVAGGGNDLDITGGAGFASMVSGIGALTADHIDSESTISATSVNVTGTSDLGGNVTTTGDQTYGGSVLLTASTELDGNNVMAGAINAGGHTLTLDGATSASTGAITNGNLVTQTAATIASGDLGTLAVGGGELNVTGNLTTTGAITGDQVLDIDGNLIAGSTTMASVLEVAGTSSLGGNVTTTGSQTFAGSVLLTADAELDGTSIMASTIDAGGNTLTLDGSTSVATGAITNGALITETDATIASFNGTTVNVTAGNLTVSGMLTASGAVTNNDTLTLIGANTAASYISNGGTLQTTGTAPDSAILTVAGSYAEMGTLATGLTRIASTPGATLIVDVSTGGGVTAGQVDLDGSTLDLTSTDTSVVAEFGERYNIIRVNGPGEITNGGGSGSIGFDTFTTAGVGLGAIDVGDILFDVSTGDVVTLGAPLVIQDDSGKAITLATSARGNSVNQRAIFNAVIAGAVDRDISGGGSANFDGADGGLGTLLSGVLADPSNLDSLNSLSPEAYAGAIDYALHATRHYSEAARLGHGHGLTSGNYQLTAGYTSFGIGSGTSADDGDYDMDGNAGFIALRYRADGSNTSYGGFVGIDEGTIEGSFLDLDTEGFVLGAFVDHQFEYDGRNWNLWGNISYGSFEYSGNRSTMIGGMTQLNSINSIDADTLEIGVGANVEVYSENGLSVRPGVGFRFLHTTVDSFSETGSISALNVNGMDYSSYLLDARVDVTYRPEGQKFGLNGHLGWQHDFANGSRDVSASFASSNEFTVIAPGLDRDALTYGVGGFYDISDNMRIDLQYRGENRKNDNSFGVDLRFTIGF